MTVEPIDPARFLAAAKRSLTRWGHVGTLSRPQNTGPSYNPAAGAAVTTPARMVALNYDAKLIDGTRIKVADKKVYLDPDGLTFEPSTNDTLLEPGVTLPLKVIAVEVLKIRTTPVLYVLQCRR